MPLITFIDSSAKTTVIQADTGVSLMAAATTNNVSGIVAACGGACACATCHCIIDEKWIEQTGQPDSLEDEMLDCTETERQNGSRLSCQVQLSDEHDGLVVHIPEEQ